MSNINKAVARPIGSQSQVMVSFGDTHIVMGSPLIRDTVSRASQPSDLLLATLVTECTFAWQAAVQTLGLSLNSLTTTAQWTETEPAAIKLRFVLNGPSAEQARQIVAIVKDTSPIYRLISTGIAIEIETVG